MAHYKQSNLSDLAYYKSSLADKISDYEDIWGNERRAKMETFRSPTENLKHDPAFTLDTFRPPPLETHQLFKHQDAEILKNKLFKRNSVPAALYTVGTQTAPAESPDNGSSADTSSPEGHPRDQYSSPFYSEPVDTVPPGRAFGQHRFSDPNLQWPPGASRRVDATLDEERLASLSSSVDNIRALSPGPPSTQWVQQLSQRMATRRDRQTQVCSGDLLAQKPPPTPKRSVGGLCLLCLGCPIRYGFY